MLFLKKHTKKRFASAILIVMVAGVLTGCSLSSNGSNPGSATNASSANDVNAKDVFASDEFIMGTVISQKVYGANGQTAIDQTVEKMKSLEKLLTFNAPEGDVYKLNQNAGKQKVQMEPETIQILKKSLEVAEMSNGAFDVTVGPLVKLWGIGTSNERVPSKEEIQSLLPLVNYKDLTVDDTSAGLKRSGQEVDLGGIAKGYAGDVAIEIYKRNGIKSGYISLGGNVVTLGNKPDGSPWIVGIRNPRPSTDAGITGEEIVGTIKVTNKAVTTAGDDQRYFEQDGQRYFHILDPHTGYPASQSDLMSVTLVTDTSFNADAYDTAVFVLGLEKGKELVQKLGMDAVFITKDKKIYVTDGLKGNFELHDESNRYQYVQD